MAHRQRGRNIIAHVMKEQSRKYGEMLNPLLFAGQGVRFRKLEVILTTSMDKLGKAGETVKVAPGYFRNFLMPRLLAVPNIERFEQLIREQRKIYEREEEEAEDSGRSSKEDKMKEYQEAAKRLANTRLVLRKFTKTEDELRIPVTKEELVSEVGRQLRVSIEPVNLHLPSALPRLGEFQVPLRLPKAIPLPEGQPQWILNVKIRRK